MVTYYLKYSRTYLVHYINTAITYIIPQISEILVPINCIKLITFILCRSSALLRRTSWYCCSLRWQKMIHPLIPVTRLHKIHVIRKHPVRTKKHIENPESTCGQECSNYHSDTCKWSLKFRKCYNVKCIRIHLKGTRTTSSIITLGKKQFHTNNDRHKQFASPHP